MKSSLKPKAGLLIVYLFASSFLYSQKIYKPTIQSCDCNFRIDSSFAALAPPAFKNNLVFQHSLDSSFKKTCGYLIVPENRKRSGSRMIKLPFIILHSKSTNKKRDPVLFTSGGPGNSSLGWINGIQKSTIIRDRDCIAFEQRGTRFAIPYLRSFELDSAIRMSYRQNLDKDSMWLEGVKRYKKTLEKKGIDLAGYNSDETVTDIHDLLKVLNIDSVNLFGGSYSGGLMTAVLQKDPSRIRSLVLDSPLPMFTPIDEDEPANFLEALKILSHKTANDSIDKEKYSNLFEKFQDYFNSIINKGFALPYYDSAGRQQLNILYTKNELLEVVVNSMLNSNSLRRVPAIIIDIINGNHQEYIKQKMDRVFRSYPAPDGMRMTVYCADQANYHDEKIVDQFYKLYPFMKGYHINDVWKAVCDCWSVPPVKSSTKQPFYSSKPVLMGDGEMDPACRPRYMMELQHYFPNSQAYLFLNRSHGVGGKDFFEMTQQFLDNPFKKIQPVSDKVVLYQ